MSRSIYQSNGKPLSQQAIYQQKLKQGIFNSPGAPSVGVNSLASDTAALLAASADLNVKPSYERTVAPEAHVAALAAKKDTISSWSRENHDPWATSAASSVKPAGSLTSESSYIADSSSVKHGVPAYSNDAVFKMASANSTSTMTSRTTPEKLASKHGLVSKNKKNNSFDINKINQLANKNSAKSIHSRFNPDLDYRHGIKHQQIHPTEYLDVSEEKLAAESAAASLKHGGGYTNLVSSQPRLKTFTAAQVVDATLLAAASAKANDRLKSINSTTPADFKNQAHQYAKALTIAQKNSEERIKNQNAGMINLGGGLSMPQSKLDELATLIVGPVLSDIDNKAKLQRETDLITKAKHEELTKQHQKAKEEEIAAKNKEKADIAQAKRERIDANEVKKKEEDGKYVEYQTTRNTEVENKQQEFEELKAKYAQEKDDLLNEKQDALNKIESEETELINNRKSELDDLQKEKDEILKPILAELEEETTKLNNLTDAKNELTNEVNSAETLNKEYTTKLSDLENQLKQSIADIEQYTVDLENSNKKHDETSKEVDELHQRSIDELAKHEESHKALDSEIETKTKTKDDHLKNKADKKQEILSHLDDRVKEEHQINKELPDHLKKTIDEDKLRDTGSLFTIEEPSVKNLSILDAETKRAEHIDTKSDIAFAVHGNSTPSNKNSNQTKARTGEHSSTDQETKKLKLEPALSSSPPSTSPKKRSIRNKITGFFGSPKSSPTKSKFDELPKKQPAPTKTNTGGVTSENDSKDRSNLEVSNGEFDDEISIGEDKNKGGVFKEEI